MKEHLQRIGVPVPEYRFCVQASDARKALKLIDARADFGGKGSAAWVVSTAITELTEARTHIDTIERLVATLAERVEMAERFAVKLSPDAHIDPTDGTGRRQA